MDIQKVNVVSYVICRNNY